jgi:hypothetical protein
MAKTRKDNFKENNKKEHPHPPPPPPKFNHPRQLPGLLGSRIERITYYKKQPFLDNKTTDNFVLIISTFDIPYEK